LNPRIRDFLIGLTAILGLAGLATTLFLIGDVQTRRTYPLEVRLDSAAGLATVSQVHLNGVKIGAIRSIQPAPNPYDGVSIAIKVFDGVRVPRDVKVSVERTFVGDATLSLTTPDEAPAGEMEFFAPGEAIHGHASSMMDQIGSLLDERLASLEGAVDSFQELSATYVRVGERLEAMLTPPAPGQTPPEGSANIAAAVMQIERAAAAVEAWLGDDEMRADAKRAVSKAATHIDQTAEAVESWTATAQTVDTQAQRLGDSGAQLARDVAALSDDLGQAVGDVRQMIGRINEGEGTLGMLLNNPDLYRAMTDAARRLEKALAEAQLLVEKYRKEGIPIQW
jgi:phospholipid/cholesterol/gamma-HCH transport system substrate-binding protein